MPAIIRLNPIEATRKVLAILDRLEENDKKLVLEVIIKLLNANAIESLQQVKERVASSTLNQSYASKKKRAAPKKKRKPRKKINADLS